MPTTTNHPQQVRVQKGTDTTYRVLALDQTAATVIRCTRTNVVYPGALPRKVSLEDFQQWAVYDPTPNRHPDPDEF